MKRYLFTFLLAVCSLFANAQQFKGGMELRHPEMREAEGQLFLSFDLDFDLETVSKYELLILTPELTNGSNRIAFPPIAVRGIEKMRLLAREERLYRNQPSYRPNYYAEISAKDNKRQTVPYRITTPYQEWMEDADFRIREDVISCAREWREQLYTFGDMTIHREVLEFVPYYSLVEPVRTKKERSESGWIFLEFEVGKYQILPAFRNNAQELQRLQAIIDDIHGNRDITITSVGIKGFASPEASYSYNDNLSKNRAYAMKDCIQKQYDFTDNQMKVSWVAEDWETLEYLIKESDLPNKQEILNIIGTTADPDEREAKIKRIAGGVPYKTMFNEMYPLLRRSEYEVAYTIRDYDLTEAADIYQKRPDQLSNFEFFQLAKTYDPESIEYENVLNQALKQYPEDPVAQINGATVLIRRGDYERARDLLRNAGNSPQALNNLGVVYTLMEDYPNAENAFRQAANAGDANARRNLDQLEKYNY